MVSQRLYFLYAIFEGQPWTKIVAYFIKKIGIEH